MSPQRFGNTSPLNEWQIEEIKKGLREADAGDFATDEEMEQTIAQWVRHAG